MSAKRGWCLTHSERVGGLHYCALANRLIDGCNDCRSMWRAVARASVLVLARSSSCIWIALIWRVRSAGLKPSIRAATVESCCASRTPDACRRCHGVAGLS